MTIDDAVEPTPEPSQLARIAASPLPNCRSRPSRPRLANPTGCSTTPSRSTRICRSRLATPVLRAFDEEVCLQGHLLSIAFMAAVEDRYGTEIRSTLAPSS